MLKMIILLSNFKVIGVHSSLYLFSIDSLRNVIVIHHMNNVYSAGFIYLFKKKTIP